MLPANLHSRKEEITTGFLQLVDQHMNDILHNRADKMYHTSHFASLLFIHPRHLTNTIKLTTGKSPCDILEERIYTESKKMLLETDLSIATIASRFTYYEPSNFIKFFKGMSGLTPLQFRKQHRTAV